MPMETAWVSGDFGMEGKWQPVGQPGASFTP